MCNARECSIIGTIVQPLSAQSVLLREPARMRVALSATAGILSATARLLIKETGFFLSEYRQASERHALAVKSTCPNATCQEPEVADLDGEFPFLCGLGTGVIVTLALVVPSFPLLLPCRTSTAPSPSCPPGSQ